MSVHDALFRGCESVAKVTITEGFVCRDGIFMSGRQCVATVQARFESTIHRMLHLMVLA